ncbi:MAG: SpoIVB peptidase [Lachnospiraceae bacterium]|nr:SpoIVB peptidase [Lachnospiraceae bacterium]
MVQNPLFSAADCLEPADDKRAVRNGNLMEMRWNNMEGFIQTIKQIFRSGTFFLMAILLCGSAAGAVSNTDTSAQMLVPVGHTVGVKLFSRGVLVVKLPDESCPAKVCGLKEGDVILACDGTTVTSTEQFQSLLQKSEGEPTDLQIHRDGVHMTVSVDPEENEKGVFCIGAWIRDSMAGIGTMTYYDPVSGTFGALGHGITDVDTLQLMPFSSGTILPSSVKAVKKGSAGGAGELKGDFDLTTTLGTLSANTECGIFGTLNAEEPGVALTAAIPTGKPKEGKAVIRANVWGDAVEEYEIEILNVITNPTDSRNMVISVTDSELIALTGGIVQGMSGSPILQNGRIVGAVTHVLVNDPTRGYGIFIENMLEAAGGGNG